MKTTRQGVRDLNSTYPIKRRKGPELVAGVNICPPHTPRWIQLMNHTDVELSGWLELVCTNCGASLEFKKPSG